MARGGKKQVPLEFKVEAPRPKLTKEGITADRLAAASAFRKALPERGRPTPGTPEEIADWAKWWPVSLPSGGSYKVPWFQEPLRAWMKAVGVSAADIKDFLPVVRAVGKPELMGAAPAPASWPDGFATKKARVIGAADLVPVVVANLAPKGGAVTSLAVEVGALGGSVVVRTKYGKKPDPWLFGAWLTGDPPEWRWVKGAAPGLLKGVKQRTVTTQAQQFLKGTWEAVAEYDAAAGPVPVRLTLRRKVSGYATLFIQGPAAAGGWRFGWEKGRSATRWWVTANWEQEGEAPNMEAAIKEGMRRLLQEVIAPSCTKRDTEKAR